ncbi:bifunctional folylpolyglutamate synthase/dihydrofolate synthase [Blautia sp. OM06-15AC]|uniref:bifunctional folylpolyglutamate synthase/dihydrofolate synthase n=1 Tax=Blautia sp. OM06-15AC TaxID=2292984 RepID=UPI000E5074CC|nr:folylpolyglutamate synthase/dihydrofolate synthase family protein [Blautia sp. OM06-15AC]RHV10902.1 bifunctional folylpolyglutamate synthase/dihydrofolate synthase [Blautia sp. OM06-15AC]
MNYTEAVDYIETIPKFTVKHPPEHTRELLSRLGNPQEGIKIIHVAGTNGKGSVCAYLNAMLLAGGKKTGLFTSPHLVRINERFQINGEDVSDEQFLDAFLKVEKAAKEYEAEGEGHPSYFETLFLMGMLIFKEAGVEYLVMETGLGGRLDATNVVEKPLACIITSISRDHTEYLGDTLEAIAGEKAGIIKAGVPVIYDASQPGPASVIAAKAKEMGSPAWPMEPSFYEMKTQSREGITFTFAYPGGEKAELAIPYVAKYQMMNASLAFYTMHILQDVHDIPKNVLAEGLSKIKWPCRMEMAAPGVIIDGAHNEDGIAQFVSTAGYFAKENEITILFTAVADKHYHEMIGEICEGIHPSHVVATQIDGSRVVPAEVLAEDFRKAGCTDVCAEPEIGAAYEKALEKKGSGMLFCVGSLYLAGELKAYLAKRNG